MTKKRHPPTGKIDNALFEQISRAKQMWQATFDAISDPVLIINQDYKIERANLATAKQSDLPIRGMIGGLCYQLFAKRDGPCPGCPLASTLKEKEAQTTWIDKMVNQKDYKISSYPFEQEGGSYSVIHHYHDVTEEKSIQQKLIQSEKMGAIGMLAGGVAHEINNPLGGILAFAQLGIKELNETDPTYSDLKEIEQAALRCKKIVDNLLRFSRQTKESDQAPLNLNSAIEGILPLIRVKLKTDGVELESDLAKKLPKVFGDSSRLQQVMLNLLTNAAQAMTAGGKIVLKTSENENGTIRVSVQDEGDGIPEENLSRIFDPYFTTKAIGEGTGLGLSICYSIVSEHGGKIEVTRNSNKGSTFSVVLPVYQQK